MTDFLTLGIRKEINQALKVNGLVKPTPIQERAIPVILTRKDIIAQAQTGTGKTLAFVLPIMEMLDPDKETVQALIITPTRELAIQITSEVNNLLRYFKGFNVLAVYGGQDVARQTKKLKGAQHIVIGTPGRLLDHMERGTIDLSDVSMLVLDEADQMLHMGFLKDVERIINGIKSERQTMMFSATMPEQIKSLAVRYMRKPVDVRVQSQRITLDGIKQIVVETTDRNKQEVLLSLLQRYNPYLAIIFCRTKKRAGAVNTMLKAQGLNSDELHGDLSQAKREGVMKRFREAKLQFLVATDVAARGLDVEGVTHVFNYDIPQDVESYIHRIGRTGRAGDKGIAITLLPPTERMYLELIEKGISQSIERQNVDGERLANRPQKRNAVAQKSHNRPKSNAKNETNKKPSTQKAGRGNRTKATYKGKR